jgi:uncharacterized protein
MIPRPFYSNELETSTQLYPIVALIGPRQAGKSTLARQFSLSYPGDTHLFDLEDPDDFRRLENPKLVLDSLRGLVILDEAQRRPELFPLLRVLADRPGTPCRFLILGSVSPELRRQASESLAGRIRYVELSGFDCTETGFHPERVNSLWVRGGFPSSYLALSEEASLDWRRQFSRTFLERDLAALGLRMEAEKLRRFWTMLAHYHGQTWNGAEIAGSLGVSANTANSYLDILSSTMMVRQLPSWFENVGKRVRRAPKIYLRDSGILHLFLGLQSYHSLTAHPKLGASWEGFALEQILRVSQHEYPEAFCWSVHSGAELDLLLFVRGQRWGFEFKFSGSPKLTKSLHSSRQDLKLDRVFVVIPNTGIEPVGYPLSPEVEVADLLTITRLFRPAPSNAILGNAANAPH